MLAASVTSDDAEAIDELFGPEGVGCAVAVVTGPGDDESVEGVGGEDGAEAEARGDALAGEAAGVAERVERASEAGVVVLHVEPALAVVA